MIDKETENKLDWVFDHADRYSIILKSGITKFKFDKVVHLDDCCGYIFASVAYVVAASPEQYYKRNYGKLKVIDWKPYRINGDLIDIWPADLLKDTLSKLIQDMSDLEIESATYTKITYERYNLSKDNNEWFAVDCSNLKDEIC